jgi:hypothetical protein
VFSSRIVVRWDGLNIEFFLLGDALPQTVQLLAEVLDLPTRRLALRAVQFHGTDARQSPLGALDEGGGHLQITQQSGGPGGGGVRLRGSLGFEKQFGLVEQALAGQG